MSLTKSARLGSYEILGSLGAGGMGEVYRARDTKLGREVAIKILPEDLAKDAQRLARFDREAHILASLNHPNIGTIYGLEESGAVRFLVLELVPGVTLADEIANGPLPVREALAYACQIAEGLESAHDKGVIHRDLKPANIKVTPEGRIKVLDFGLAKGRIKEPPGADSSNSYTVTVEGTEPGLILGTPSYMSPEQARGKPVDKHTDIWSFGCVLYEMLSGKRAFRGETVSDKIAAILSREPDWDALSGETPLPMRDLLQRCLQKDVKHRLHDVGDARMEIEQVLMTSDNRWSGLWLGKRALLGLGALVIALALLLTWVVIWPRLVIRRAIPQEKILAVLPFKDLSDPSSRQSIGEGMVETLSVRLGQVPGIQVIIPASVVAAADKEADPMRVAKNLRANLLLEGSVQSVGDRLRISYSLWNPEERVRIDGDDVTGLRSELFDMQDSVAERVGRSLRLLGGPPLPVKPSGLETASEQSHYTEAIGFLQRRYKESSVDEAIRLLDALSNEKPGSTVVQAALVRAYLSKFDITRTPKWVKLATEACSRAQHLDPNFPDVDITLGELYIRTGQVKEARGAFERALSAQPNSFEAMLGLANAYGKSGSAGDAESTYRRAINLQSSYWMGYSYLASFYFNRGSYSQAAELFLHVTEITPDNARAFSNLGVCYEYLEDLDRALSAFKKSLALDRNPLAYSNLGTAQFFSGHFRESVEAFEAAVALTPDHYLRWANLGDAYRWTAGLESKAPDAYAHAIALCRNELRMNPQDERVHYYLAFCLAKTGRLPEADNHIQKALSINPGNNGLLYNAAVVANIARKPKEALDWIQRAARAGYPRAFIARDPEFANLRNEIAFKEVIQGSTR